MKTISIEELHEQTERVVGEAAQATIVVTKNGRPQAILRPYPQEAALKRYWEERERTLAALPRIDADSAEYVSQDRDRR